jgi:hypothetical protein
MTRVVSILDLVLELELWDSDYDERTSGEYCGGAVRPRGLDQRTVSKSGMIPGVIAMIYVGA